MGFPKGHLEEGETPLEAAARETHEETGKKHVLHLPAYQRTLVYGVTRGEVEHEKTVHYFCAETDSPKVTLSKEHREFEWFDYEDAQDALVHPTLTNVLRDAALFLKDPALYAHSNTTQADAERHLHSQPECTPMLLAHLQGGAALARSFAVALQSAGTDVDVEATAIATLLHDVGRALGDHADHQRAGLRHLRQSPFDAYGFACITHFTKGASTNELIGAGLSEELAGDFAALQDLRTLTWEERCAALADACMKHDKAVSPTLRFADLRARYDASALIDLQEQKTEEIRAAMHGVLGTDPLGLVEFESALRNN